MIIVSVVGVVGILLEAKTKGAVDAVRPHLDTLRQTADLRPPRREASGRVVGVDS